MNKAPRASRADSNDNDEEIRLAGMEDVSTDKEAELEIEEEDELGNAQIQRLAMPNFDL